jgi:hypothetical protein
VRERRNKKEKEKRGRREGEREKNPPSSRRSVLIF